MVKIFFPRSSQHFKEKIPKKKDVRTRKSTRLGSLSCQAHASSPKSKNYLTFKNILKMCLLKVKSSVTPCILTSYHMCSMTPCILTSYHICVRWHSVCLSLVPAPQKTEKSFKKLKTDFRPNQNHGSLRKYKEK